MRQDHREALPKILAEKFSRKLSKVEWGQLHLGLARTDLAALGDTLSVKGIREILSNDGKRQEVIRETEEALYKLAPKASQTYFRKARELAQFMVTGRIDPGNHKLLKNAESISLLLGEPGEVKGAAIDQQKVDAISRLVSLYALGFVDKGTQESLANLVQKESEGVDFLLYYMGDLRRKEMESATTPEARLNGYQGYVPSEAREGSKLIVAEDLDYNQLITLGYTRMGDYDGSGMERGKRGYYFSALGGKGIYSQGAMQTVQKSSRGVDPRNGRTVSGTTGGLVPAHQVAQIKAKIQKGQYRAKGEALMPLYDGSGEVVGYERHVAPEQAQALRRNDHLGEMIGAWAGRQAEEALAGEFNKTLVDRVKEVWDKGKKDGRAEKEFVDLSRQTEDQVWMDSWKMIPPETKKYIEEVFGDDGFMVRRDMINNAVG